jgi:hypothetical protein
MSCKFAANQKVNIGAIREKKNIEALKKNADSLVLLFVYILDFFWFLLAFYFYKLTHCLLLKTKTQS